jgi:hypothetical protein
MRKGICAIFLFAVITTAAYNQQDSVVRDADQLISVSPENNSSIETPSKKDRLNTNLEAGTSFVFSPHNFYGPSYYISPGLSYKLTPHFYLSAGIALQYSTFYPLYNQNETSQKMLPMTQAFIYTKGSYFISPRLVVNGTIYKNLMDAPQLTENSRAMNYNYQGLSVGFNYKFSNSFSFGIQMNMQNGSYKSDDLIPASGYVPVPGF